MSTTKIAVALAMLMGVLFAPTTSALGAEFSTESTWSGKAEHQVVELGTIQPGECKTVHLEGVSPKNATNPTALIKPTYDECEAETLPLNKEAIVVETHECEYELFNAKGVKSFTSEAKLVNCPTGIQMKFKKSGCEVNIPEQAGSKVESGQNLNTVKGSYESEANVPLKGFKYTATAKCSNIGLKSGNGAFTGSALSKGLIVVGSGGVVASPTEVKFGNITKGSIAVEYTNEGSSSWVVPTLEYTVIEGGAKSVKPKNGCLGLTVNPGEKCSVTLNYSVTSAEKYLAELKLGSEAPVVSVRAEA